MPEDSLPGLKSLLQAALHQSPTMIQEDITIYQNRAIALQAYSAFWPQVSAGGGYGRTRDRVSETQNGQKIVTAPGQDPWNYSGAINYNIGVNQNLFQWGAIVDRAKVAHLGVLISERQYAEAYRTLVLQVRDQYLNLAQARSSLRSAEFSLKLSRDALAVAEDKLKNGIISATAIQGPRLDVDDQQLDYDRKAETYVHAKRLLAQLAGLKDIADGDIPAEVPKPLYSQAAAGEVLATFLRDGARSTFLAQVYLMQIREANLNYKIAYTNLLPHFSASVGVGQSTVTTINPGVAGGVSQSTVLSESYNVGASWDVFDGFATRGQRRSALAQRRLSESQFQAYADAALEDAQDKERQLNFAVRAEALAEVRRDIANSELQQQQGEFKLGNQPQSAVDAATANLYLNDAFQASARSEVFSRWSALVSLAGLDPALDVLPNHYVRPINW